MITLVRKCESFSIYPKRSLQISTLNFLVTCQNLVTIFMYTPFLCPNHCLKPCELIPYSCWVYQPSLYNRFHTLLCCRWCLRSTIFWIILPVSSTTQFSFMLFKYVSVRRCYVTVNVCQHAVSFSCSFVGFWMSWTTQNLYYVFWQGWWNVSHTNGCNINTLYQIKICICFLESNS